MQKITTKKYDHENNKLNRESDGKITEYMYDFEGETEEWSGTYSPYGKLSSYFLQVLIIVMNRIQTGLHFGLRMVEVE